MPPLFILTDTRCLSLAVEENDFFKVVKVYFVMFKEDLRPKIIFSSKLKINKENAI